MKKTNRVAKSDIRASINAWSIAFGMSHENLCILLRRADIQYTPGQDISASDVFAAVTMRSEKDAAISRQANAKAEEQEMINAERRKQLMNVAQIEKVIWGDLLQPLRLEMEQMPKSLCALVNPQEPESAEKTLQQWVEKIKLNIKDKK